MHCCNQNCLSLFANDEFSADMHACCMQNMEKEENVVKWWSLAWLSLFTHVRTFMVSFPLLAVFFICFLTTPTPFSSADFMSMNWAQLLCSSFFLSFLRFSLKKMTCYRVIDDVCVRVCAEAALKEKVFLFLHLTFWVLAHDCDQDERKCDQKNGARVWPA